ncbi:MAG: DUF3445 domain-containing protein [Verrucomicrobiaceae bacterium]|nr:MAG: DUF3445 domain-containing protein [Verrucomicrobiaceae bacterium]
MNFAALFSGGDFRFQLGLRRGSPAEFFRPVDPALTAQRRQWLRHGGDRYLYSAMRPDGLPLLEECRALAAEWGVPSSLETGAGTSLPSVPPEEQCARLGEVWEPDFLLVRAAGDFPLLGGCVCFPSSWSLPDKIGRSVAAIHGEVPGLNAALGRGIDTLLGKLTPDTAWFRHNWGLSRSPELNQHPSRRLPRLDSGVTTGEVWLRVEHQAFTALPASGGILFSIRITMHPLTEVRQDAEASARLVRALRTMPEEVARYKGLATVRERLTKLLEEGG